MSGGDQIIPRPLAEVLGELVRLAEQLLAKPYLLMAKREQLDALAGEVKAWIKRPPNGARVIDERAIWLVDCVRHVCEASSDAERGAWSDLAMVLTEHAMAALAAALAVRPSP